MTSLLYDAYECDNYWLAFVSFPGTGRSHACYTVCVGAGMFCYPEKCFFLFWFCQSSALVVMRIKRDVSGIMNHCLPSLIVSRPVNSVNSLLCVTNRSISGELIIF